MSDRSSAPPMQRRGGPRPTETRMLRPPIPIDNRTGATQVENSPKNWQNTYERNWELQ